MYISKKIVTILFLLVTLSISLFSEDIFFSARTSFSDAQFWEKDTTGDGSGGSRNVFSNFAIGSIGVTMEMVIWDPGKKRGSRIFFKTGIDLLFAGPTYLGSYPNNISGASISSINMGGGAFYMGFDMDLYFGGTFPKTNLFWGLGSGFNFLFPAYSPKYSTSNFVENFHFFATPSLLIGYDFFIKNPAYKMKITPQIKTGFTCIPLIPDDLLGDMTTTGGKYSIGEMYSGFYIDLSVGVSFYSIKWKK